MRVLICSSGFIEQADGVARTLRYLSQSLGKRQIDHWVYAPTLPNSDEGFLRIRHLRSIPFILYPQYRLVTPTKRLYKEFDALKPDVVHLVVPDLMGNFGLKYAKSRGLPTVACYHTDWPSYLKYFRLTIFQGYIDRLMRRFYGGVDVCFAPTKKMQASLGQMGIENVRLWQRGIEQKLFNPQRRDLSLRQQWGGDDKLYIAFLGRLVWYKGLKEYREVYRQLNHKYPNIKFVLIGDGPAKEELKRTMPEAIFAGYVTKQEVGRFVGSCDLMVFPSITETFGQVVNESVAVGVPTVVSDKGGTSEIIRNSGGGLVARAEDSDDFAAKTAQLIDDVELREKCRQSGIAYGKTLSWESINSVVIDAYEEVIDSVKKQGAVC